MHENRIPDAGSEMPVSLQCSVDKKFGWQKNDPSCSNGIVCTCNLNSIRTQLLIKHPLRPSRSLLPEHMNQIKKYTRITPNYTKI